MYQNQLLPGLRSESRWWSLQSSLDPLAGGEYYDRQIAILESNLASGAATWQTRKKTP